MKQSLSWAPLMRLGTAALLLITLGSGIYGHAGGARMGLSLFDNYITEYLQRAPHWPWLVVASFSLALLLMALALAFLSQTRASLCRNLGCLLLAACAMSIFFVAYGPVRKVDQPPAPAHAWWTPAWWFTSQRAHTAYETGMADAYRDVHYRATRLTVVTGVAAILLMGISGCCQPENRRFGKMSLWLGVTMGVLFLMGDRLMDWRGLWQRLGFGLMYVWFWLAFVHAARDRHINNLAGPALPEKE
jgi:hypothetical protein